MSPLLEPGKKPIHVVAGVIVNKAGEILIAKRSDDKHKGGLWEFPGGKMEGREQPRQTLVRELKEEIGIQVIAARPFIKILHDYPDKSIILDVWRVGEFEGEAEGLEGQPVKWVPKDELSQYDFPEADFGILSAIQLPEQYPISIDPTTVGGLKVFMRQFREVVERPATKMVQVRAKTVGDNILARLLAQCQEIAKENDASVIVNEKYQMVSKYELAGVHLSSHQLQTLLKRPLPRGKWVSASCHSLKEIELANKLGADFVVLSPVNRTPSHPKQQPIGWDTFEQLALQSRVPVYALGGLGKEDLSTAWRYGAHGVAGISSFWPS